MLSTHTWPGAAEPWAGAIVILVTIGPGAGWQRVGRVFKISSWDLVKGRPYYKRWKELAIVFIYQEFTMCHALDKHFSSLQTSDKV